MMIPMEHRFEEWDKDLTLMRAAARDLRTAEVGLHFRVGAARRSGHSWAVIGVVLGTSGKEAEKRFGSQGRPTG